jgi:hypothetical protein
MRGGQVTLYVAVGLVLMLTFAFFYFMLRPQASPNLGEGNYPALSNYLGSCLDLVMNEELDKLGQSGGLSVMEYPAFAHATVETEDVIYGVTVNRRQSPELAPYPAENELRTCILNPGSCTPQTRFQAGVFGDVQFPAICEPENSVACSYYPRSPPGTPSISVQSRFTARITERMTSCADAQQLSRSLGVQVSAGAPQVNVTFTRTGVIASLIYPLTLENGQESVPLHRTYKVRYLPVAEYAYDLARQITRDPTFNASADYANRSLLGSYAEGFSVQARKVNIVGVPSGVPAQSAATLITVTDEQSSLRGEPFRFSFLVEKRPLVALGPSSSCAIVQVYDLDKPGLLELPIEHSAQSCKQAFSTLVPGNWDGLCQSCAPIDGDIGDGSGDGPVNPGDVLVQT